MKKIDLGQMLNTLANVGVIAGIVFLAFELRQNNDLLTAQARVARHELRSNDANRVVLQNLDLASVLVKARDGESLTPSESLAVEKYLDQFILDWQFVYVEYQRGLLGAEEIPIQGWRDTLVEYPTMREIWKDRSSRGYYREDFVAWIEENVTNPR